MSFRHGATAAALFALCLWFLAARAKPGSPDQRTDIVPANLVDVTASSGVEFHHYASQTAKKYMLEIMGSGVALFDFDNDGRLDIFLVNGAPISDPTPLGTIPRKSDPKYWHRLYHQKPDGRFEDVTERAGVEGKGYGYGVAVGDYDNDGFEDLFVTEYGGNRLYHNNGNGTFTDVTEKAGVGGSGWSTSAAWVDLDSDGFLDLVVLRYVQWDFEDRMCLVNGTLRTYCRPDSFPPIEPLVYHNNGDSTFTEVSRQIGLSKPGKGLGLAIADYDRDGHVDVYVANDSMPGFLYHNKGNGTFEEVALLAGVGVTDSGRTYAGMGVDFADYNNHGLPDLAVADLAFDKYALYENEGNGFFKYATDATGLGNITMQHSGMGLHFIDYDNDGRKDLLVSQGHVMDTVDQVSANLHYREPILLVRNTPQGFVDVSAASGEVFRQAWAGRGLAIGDINNDGRVDAVVSTSEGPAHVLLNQTATSNHWLMLKMTGHRSNRDAIGAEVKVVTARGMQMATVTTAGSYLSSSDKRVHFGLGSETTVQKVEIRWPSGILQTLRDVKADQILEVDEPR
ncbi:ASPIC/UnbV domain protein [Acidobacteriia bacterium SbA2]|nr:ASPIC/UnbV domain protein [Acidobacteriia bacterium SbA2]